MTPRKPSRERCGVAINVKSRAEIDCTFADINRACHRWLMQHDKAYKRDRENQTRVRP